MNLLEMAEQEQAAMQKRTEELKLGSIVVVVFFLFPFLFFL